jgi:hypothetical protein
MTRLLVGIVACVALGACGSPVSPSLPAGVAARPDCARMAIDAMPTCRALPVSSRPPAVDRAFRVVDDLPE